MSAKQEIPSDQVCIAWEKDCGKRQCVCGSTHSRHRTCYVTRSPQKERTRRSIPNCSTLKQTLHTAPIIFTLCGYRLAGQYNAWQWKSYYVGKKWWDFWERWMLGAGSSAVAPIPWSHLFFGRLGTMAFSVFNAGNLHSIFSWKIWQGNHSVLYKACSFCQAQYCWNNDAVDLINGEMGVSVSVSVNEIVSENGPGYCNSITLNTLK